MSSTAWPRVTFAVIAYKQAELVEDAIASAFAQSYPNLQILLSDDCSPDQTFDLMRAAAAAYKGPHQVTLNRNLRNLHIGGHVSTVNRLAEGELVVVAAGDDVSDPERTAKLVEAWLSGGKRAGVLHSACYRLHGNSKARHGNPTLGHLASAELAARHAALVIGATEAWDKSMFDHFGDFREGLVHEDHALPFRSLLLGRPVTYVDEPLVSYRQGTGVSAIYGRNHLEAKERRLFLSRSYDEVLQKLDDLAVAPQLGVGLILEQQAERFRVALRFEENWPSVSDCLRWGRSAGYKHVARMFAKRLRNHLKDRLVQEI